MNCAIHLEQKLVCDDQVVLEHTWEQSMAKDKYKALIGDGNARVSMSMSERMGGPYGYSSTSINVTVTINCDQSEEVIQKAQEAAFTEAALAIDTWFPKAHSILKAHLADYYEDD